MTQEQINTSLDKMLENPKAKTFLNHIIRAYMPSSNIIIVSEKPKGDFKCVLTQEHLVTSTEIKKALDEKLAAFFNDNLRKVIENKADVGEFLGGKALGVTGKDTTTFMTYPASQHLIEWVLKKSASGDKHINWVLAGIRKLGPLTNKKPISDTPKVKSATFSLSDSSDVLSKLKAQLEEKGK